MRNTYKYTRLYSGAEPQFVEGDIFRTIIPLGEAVAATVGPTSVSNVSVTTEVSTEVTTEVKLDPMKLTELLNFCTVPRTRKEMQDYCGIKTEKYFREKIIKPMLTEGFIKRTIPDKPNCRNQKYIKA